MGSRKKTVKKVKPVETVEQIAVRLMKEDPVFAKTVVEMAGAKQEAKIEEKQPVATVDEDKVSLTDYVKSIAGNFGAVIAGAAVASYAFTKSVVVGIFDFIWGVLKGGWNFVRSLFTRENVRATSGVLKQGSNLALIGGTAWLAVAALMGGPLTVAAYVAGAGAVGSGLFSGIGHMMLEEDHREESTLTFTDILNPAFKAA